MAVNLSPNTALAQEQTLLVSTQCELGAEWMWRNPLPQGHDLNGVTWDGGQFVAVGGVGTILTNTPSRFIDVPFTHPFYKEIEALAASGITTGYPDGTFRPSNPVTRQAMAAFLVRGLELDQSYNVPAVPTFSDVPLTHPFYEEIEILAASGITTGFPDGTFRSSNNVTRMAVAAFLSRALELDKDYEVPAQPTFHDVSSDHPFFDEIELLSASGITTGYNDNTFRPSNNVTRMAMAAFLVRGLELE